MRLWSRSSKDVLRIIGRQHNHSSLCVEPIWAANDAIRLLHQTGSYSMTIKAWYQQEFRRGKWFEPVLWVQSVSWKHPPKSIGQGKRPAEPKSISCRFLPSGQRHVPPLDLPVVKVFEAGRGSPAFGFVGSRNASSRLQWALLTKSIPWELYSNRKESNTNAM